MKIRAESIADAPPRGAVVLRAAGRRAASGDAVEDRCITYVASDPSVGRDFHTIAADAWQTENFLQNPVFLFAHDDAQPPIGRVVALRTVNRQLLATVRYAKRDVYPFADVCFQLVKGGYLNAVSTGWLPLEWRAANDRNRPGGLDFTKVDLLELSQVAIPALPTALATARSAGIDLAPLGAWAERALDSRRSIVPTKELQMIRSAAGAAKVYPVPRAPLAERAAQGNRAADPATGFRSFGEFLQTAARASARPETADRRLVRAPSGAGEVDPSAGGFLVPATYVEHLIESVYESSVIAPLCESFETSIGGESHIPGIDETSRVDGSRWGGAWSYWEEEGDSVAASRPKFRSVSFASKKLFALCVASGELIADAPMLGAYVSKAFSQEMSFKLDAAILAGSGAGLPLGLMNSSALITVAKANGQLTQTITADNIEAMWRRLPSSSRRRACWLCNEDAESQISQFNAATTWPSTAGMYVPAGVAGNQWPLLKSVPLIVVEQSQPLGTPGDIILADLTQYALVDAGQRMDLSVESSFLSDQGVFRFVWRIDGKPLWSSAITPSNGSGLTRSPFVALAQR